MKVRTRKRMAGSVFLSACESAQLIRDLGYARQIPVAYHADHISAKESVEALRQAKRDGVNCTAEVTAHHLLLEDRDVQDAMEENESAPAFA